MNFSRLKVGLIQGVTGADLLKTLVERGRDVVRFYDLFWHQDYQTLYEILQLSDVARPWIFLQDGQDIIADSFLGQTAFLSKFLQKIFNQQGDVLRTISQWRYLDGDDVQAIVEILPKPSLVDLPLQIFVGGSYDSNIHLDDLAAPHTLEALLFQNSQDFRLGFQAHVANFVQKKGAMIGQIKASPPPLIGAGESTSLVPKELAFNKILRDCSAVDLDQRTRISGAEMMDGPRHQLFSGAVLTCYQHGGVSRSYAFDCFLKLTDSGSIPGDFVRDSRLLAQNDVVIAELAEIYGVLNGDQGSFQGKGLFDKIVSPELGSGYRCLNATVTRYHDNLEPRVERAHTLECLYAIDSWHPNV